jgi:hypothetical protein
MVARVRGGVVSLRGGVATAGGRWRRSGEGWHREADRGMVAGGEEGAVARKKRRDLVGTGKRRGFF